MLGYALTGRTREHALFFGYGIGANGKGVTINTVAGILADYAQTADRRDLHRLASRIGTQPSSRPCGARGS